MKTNIKNNSIHKVEEEFIVTKKGKNQFSSEVGSDSGSYYLTLTSLVTKEKKKISISEKDFKLIKIKSKILLIYYEKLDLLSEVNFNDMKFENPSIKFKAQLNIFEIIKKYR